VKGLPSVINRLNVMVQRGDPRAAPPQGRGELQDVIRREFFESLNWTGSVSFPHMQENC
jgi:hypothetical protein